MAGKELSLKEATETLQRRMISESIKFRESSQKEGMIFVENGDCEAGQKSFRDLIISKFLEEFRQMITPGMIKKWHEAQAARWENND